MTSDVVCRISSWLGTELRFICEGVVTLIYSCCLHWLVTAVTRFLFLKLGNHLGLLFFFFWSRLHGQDRAQCRAQTHDPDIKTWAEIKSRMLNQLSHLGAPHLGLKRQQSQQLLPKFLTKVTGSDGLNLVIHWIHRNLPYYSKTA